MDSRNQQNKPLARAAAVVEASTLKDALRQVRQRYGADARVIRSRTLTRRKRGGLGQEKVIEVLVEPANGAGRRRRTMDSDAGGPPWRELTGEIAAEVERIEGLVKQIARDHPFTTAGPDHGPTNRLAASLIENGAEPTVVHRLCERCQAETGARPDDRTALLNYLTRSLPTGRGGWEEFGGTHVFLGTTGCGRTELVLATAARLVRDKRNVLVLGLLPRHGGEVRRLQAHAAKHGYDAAVIQKPRQLAAATEHLAGYDVVLIDAPSFSSPALASDQSLHQQIVNDPSFHRHLVFPLDRDLRDIDAVIRNARTWNCDWLALTRVDQTSRLAKILELLELLPLPLSLVGDVTGGRGEPRVAEPGFLTDLMLAGDKHHVVAEG